MNRQQSVTHLLAIGAGGSVGALGRWLIDRGTLYVTGVPLAGPTFVVNISGSFLIGLFFALITERAVLPAWLRGPLMIGVIGSYTTFSTLALAAWRMIEEGAWLFALANMGGSIVLGMVGLIAGIVVGRLL